MGLDACLLFISGCNLWFQRFPSVFIRVHRWLQSVLPLVSIRVYPCSSVVAICGSNGFHPCLSVFIGGCNLWFHWCLCQFIRLHRCLQFFVIMFSFIVYEFLLMVLIHGSIVCL